MSKFTQQEIDAEHRRRGSGQEGEETSSLEHGDVCIHCGSPLAVPLGEEEAGLCDSCLSQDD